jgi:hypothetical protein
MRRNHPQFLQNLPVPYLQTKTGMIDVPALDLMRDRERGVSLRSGEPGT